MLFKVTYNYMQSSTEGGRDYAKEEVVLYNCSEGELIRYVNNFLKDTKSGYRYNISLRDVVRI